MIFDTRTVLLLRADTRTVRRLLRLTHCGKAAGSVRTKDRLPDTQITLNNNVLNLTADDRRRRIEELQRKVLTYTKPRDES